MSLLDFFFGKKAAPQQPAPQPPQQGFLGVPSGGTQQAYKDYAEQSMVKGQQPLSFADWYKQQAQAQKK